LERSGVLGHPDNRTVLDAMVRRAHAFREGLPEMEQRATARRQAAEQAKAQSQADTARVQAMSQREYDLEYGKLFMEWRRADDENDGNARDYYRSRCLTDARFFILTVSIL
jgi:hypothetical protein